MRLVLGPQARPAALLAQVDQRVLTEVRASTGLDALPAVLEKALQEAYDTFGVSVSQCRLHRVTSLVESPDVHPHSTSTRHQLGCSQEHRATSAAEVEYAFVAPQPDLG